MISATQSISRVETSNTTEEEVLVSGLFLLLDQCTFFLEQMSGEQYSKPVSESFSPIGAQMRHILEFVGLCFDSYQIGALNYEKRQRDLVLETDRLMAIEKIVQLRRECMDFINADLSRPVFVTETPSADAPEIEVPSSFGRELFFVIEHSIHHLAQIKILCHHAGIELPQDIGMAPGTIRHNRSQTQ